MKNVKLELPPLASFRPLSKYQPAIGDFVIWAGFFRTWYGVVSLFDATHLTIVFESLPILLFTLMPEEQNKNTKKITIDKVRSGISGSFTIMQHAADHNTIIWYV